MDTAGLISTLALILATTTPPQPASDSGAAVPPAQSATGSSAPVPAAQPTTGEQPAPTPVAPPPQPAPEAAPAARCDAASWRWLRGRSLNELLAQRLPEGSRIVRVGDAPLPAEAIRGRLVVEIGRNTRVRRVFCG